MRYAKLIIEDILDPVTVQVGDSVSNWGELKEGINQLLKPEDYEVTLVPSFHTLSHDEAVLPQEDFTLFIFKLINEISKKGTNKSSKKNNNTKLSK